MKGKADSSPSTTNQFHEMERKEVRIKGKKELLKDDGRKE